MYSDSFIKSDDFKIGYYKIFRILKCKKVCNINKKLFYNSFFCYN